MLIWGRFATFWINLGCDDLLRSALIWERCVASLSCVALRYVALLTYLAGAEACEIGL